MENNTPTAQALDPSELGTKEYWDGLYARELQNHDDDPEDEGTIWFEESNAEQAVLKQLNQLADDGLLIRGGDGGSSSQPSRFLDLGTGNGHMLFSLRENDDGDDDGQMWYGEMLGVDYSEASIQLAQRIARQRFEEAASSQLLRFEQWDLLADQPGETWKGNGFDVVLDKGTFDAISLMQRREGSENPCVVYRNKVAPLVKPGYFLFVTSCNWTRDELVAWLAPEHGELKFYKEAKYRTFTFGGRSGQSVVTVIFRRQDSREKER